MTLQWTKNHPRGRSDTSCKGKKDKAYRQQFYVQYQNVTHNQQNRKCTRRKSLIVILRLPSQVQV